MTERTATYVKVPRDEPRREQPVMRSAAHRLHASMGGVFEDRGRWQVPALYGSDEVETDAVRTALGYADVSAQGKVHLSGALEPLLRVLIGGSMEPLSTGAVGADGLVARVARDWALMLTPPSQEGELLARLEGEKDGGAMATDVTSSLSGFLVAGPHLRDFLARTVTLDPAELTTGRCAAASWARIPALIVVSELAGPAVELYVGSEYGRYAWETLRDVCGRLGGSPVGWTALESMGWRT